MKSIAKVLLLAALVLGLAGIVMAETGEDTQTVTITFYEISEIAASGDPGPLLIEAPLTPGDLPEDDTDASTTMAWTSNVAAGLTRKITGSIDVLFSGINLYATIAAPGDAGGTSEDELLFAAADTDYEFVTAIGNCNVTAQTITFRAEVTEMVTPYEETEQIVTWTLIEDA